MKNIKWPEYHQIYGNENHRTKLIKDERNVTIDLCKAAVAEAEGQPMDRKDAEKYAQMIWDECATTGAIADLLQKYFGQPNDQYQAILQEVIKLKKDKREFVLMEYKAFEHWLTMEYLPKHILEHNGVDFQVLSKDACAKFGTQPSNNLVPLDKEELRKVLLSEETIDPFPPFRSFERIDNTLVNLKVMRIMSKFGTQPARNTPSVEQIKDILNFHRTHFLHYHDKEGGRISEVEAIFKERFDDCAIAIKKLIEDTK